jgi:uncharacterized protein YcbK (DUF882 family)
MALSRRSLIAAGAGLALAPTSMPALAQAGEPRLVKMVNLHTGERFEDIYHDGRRYLLDALDTLDWFLRDHHADTAFIMDMGTIDLVWRLQQYYVRARGHRPWVNVHSAYRTPETNRALVSEGAALNSYHMRGQAIDISVQGYGMHILANFAQAVQTGGLGLYWRSDFVHLDTGPRRLWYRR